MRQDEHLTYAVIRENRRSQQRAVVMLVQGWSRATFLVERLNDRLSEETREAGWKYHHQRTNLPPKTDPLDATKILILRGEI